MGVNGHLEVAVFGQSTPPAVSLGRAALSLGMTEGDSRMEIIGKTPTNAPLPNLDSTGTVGLVTSPGAFVGVLLSTGPARTGPAPRRYSS